MLITDTNILCKSGKSRDEPNYVGPICEVTWYVDKNWFLRALYIIGNRCHTSRHRCFAIFCRRDRPAARARPVFSNAPSSVARLGDFSPLWGFLSLLGKYSGTAILWGIGLGKCETFGDKHGGFSYKMPCWNF